MSAEKTVETETNHQETQSWLHRLIKDVCGCNCIVGSFLFCFDGIFKELRHEDVFRRDIVNKQPEDASEYVFERNFLRNENDAEC